ncbi:MAG: hypothetical protein ACRED0_08050 [Gammaproteobacteria bacterium]
MLLGYGFRAQKSVFECRSTSHPGRKCEVICGEPSPSSELRLIEKAPRTPALTDPEC